MAPASPIVSTLSLHDALPILPAAPSEPWRVVLRTGPTSPPRAGVRVDRKSTRLNSSHLVISYAVFCLKKKNSEYRDSSQLVNSPWIVGVVLMHYVLKASNNAM